MGKGRPCSFVSKSDKRPIARTRPRGSKPVSSCNSRSAAARVLASSASARPPGKETSPDHGSPARSARRIIRTVGVPACSPLPCSAISKTTPQRCTHRRPGIRRGLCACNPATIESIEITVKSYRGIFLPHARFILNRNELSSGTGSHACLMDVLATTSPPPIFPEW